ncbi:ABC transporter substrate-binding protein [Nocardia sp. NPDC020380]|uniref:ABC transporter substrate-binding protein n=1 Tax=Nocardia sp. NPDC020380 TaxID=3364309 RepID=UPI0037921506
MNRRDFARTAVLAVTAVLAADACSPGHSNVGPGDLPGAPPNKLTLDPEGLQSTGPAAPLPGAQTGGTLNVTWRNDFPHYDPVKVYTSPDDAVFRLINRRLTVLKQNDDGSMVLVGDLATDTGTASDGGSTWKYTLKDGVTYADGTPIVSRDIKYAVERSFDSRFAMGPKWVQQWLIGNDDYNSVYQGPYKGQELGPDKIETPDDKTIIFHLAAPQSDFPFAVSMTQTVPVRKALDTDQNALDANGLGDMITGPYKIDSHAVDRTLVLVRNPHWDPKTDPVRHQYVDKMHFQFGVQPKQETDQLRANMDPHSAALYNQIDVDQVQDILADSELKQRTIDAELNFVMSFQINNARVTDPNVRKAIATAFPKQDVINTQGGPYYGAIATTFSPRAAVGYSPQPNPYGVGDNGDPQLAKQILTAAGKLGYVVNVCWDSTPAADRMGAPIKRALEAAGFKVNLDPVADKGYYDAIEHLQNPYDLIWYQWAPDWPTNRTVYSALFSSGQVMEGGSAVAQVKSQQVDDSINRVQAIQDIEAQGAQYMPLDQKIQKDYGAAIPVAYVRKQMMFGSKVRGVRVDVISTSIDLSHIYLER